MMFEETLITLKDPDKDDGKNELSCSICQSSKKKKKEILKWKILKSVKPSTFLC